MSPEFPPGLVILELLGGPDKLVANVTYVEPKEEKEQMRVRWSEQVCPPNFTSVGNGVAHVQARSEVLLLAEKWRVKPSKFILKENARNGR